MDELPRHARDVVRLARDQHDCLDGDARARVRQGVAEALAAHADGGAGLEGQRSPYAAGHAGPLAGAAAKLTMVTVAIAVVGAALTYGLRTPPAGEAAARSAPTPSFASSPAEDRQPSSSSQATESSLDARARDAAASRRSAVAPRPRRADTLDGEVELLHRVRDAVSRGDARSARRLLEQHTASFPRPALLEEREGFQAIVRCVEARALASERRMERRRGALTRARAFVQRYPHSVLTQRVQRECELELELEGEGP
jgi:hypothetical protein